MARSRTWAAEKAGYFKLQGTRPQTLGYGLEDSPAGQLAWSGEKFKEWTDSAKELPDDAVPRDRLLANRPAPGAIILDATTLLSDTLLTRTLGVAGLRVGLARLGSARLPGESPQAIRFCWLREIRRC